MAESADSEQTGSMPDSKDFFLNRETILGGKLFKGGY